MRPILAILGAAILVAVALAAYFVPAGSSASGTVASGDPQVVQVASGYTFLPNVPVSLTVTSLPPGAQVGVIPCPIGVTNPAQCEADSTGFLDVYNNTANVVYSSTITLNFNINSGHPFLVLTTASAGAKTTFTATSPLWAGYTILIVALLVASVVLVAIGLHHPHKPRSPQGSTYVDRSGYAAEGAPRQFCEACGNPYASDATTFCTNCGAPRT